jgi:phosphonate degradation associated HDIG domain protein
VTVARLSSLDDLERLYAGRGELAYGEGVSQIEHALQCAALAEAEGDAPSLIAASLLHDVGHLFEDEAVALSTDARHEAVGAAALKDLFDEAVRQPIALHVMAKRWLCLREAAYYDALSPASQASLAMQGGPFDEAQAEAFERRPYWREAVALRRYDDLGKREDLCGKTFADYLPLLAELSKAYRAGA